MELVAEGVFNAIGGGLKTFFGQLAELLLFALVIVSGEDSVFAAGAVLVNVIRGAFVRHIGAEMVIFGSGAKRISVGVKSGEGNGATISVEEVEEEVGLLVIGSELAEDLILMGAKPS
jgi:hypothetical protein